MALSRQAPTLIRETDGKVLSPMVGDNWEPVQNSEAFDFFGEYCLAGDMEMHTAGSLADGKNVWVLAKVNESFDVLGEDRVDSFLLFSNPHQYGKSLNVRFTPIRVVCNNTLTMSLSDKSKNEVALNHHKAFDPTIVKEQLGIAHEKFEMYKDAARFLAKKQTKIEDLVQYFNAIFPNETRPKRSRPTKICLVLRRRPTTCWRFNGAEFAMNTYWNAVNAVTYMTDHELGRNADTRMQSAWFGANQTKKLKAMNLSLEMADRLHNGNRHTKTAHCESSELESSGHLDTFLLGWLLSGSIEIGAAIGGAEVITKTFLYYFHERLWYRYISFGVKHRESLL